VSPAPPSHVHPARVPAFVAVAASLLLAHPAQPATLRLPAIAAPSLPAAEGPPPSPASFVHARLTLPIDSLRLELERHLPAQLRAADVTEEVSPEEVLKDDERAAARAGVRWRGPIRRGRLEAAGHGDTLVLRAPVHYRLEIEGSGFAPARCGHDADSLLGFAGTQTRFAWGEGWRLEARSRPLAVVYPTRCKPRPPAINFTKLVDDRIKGSLVAPLARSIDSLAAATDLAARVAALHGALARPVPLGAEQAWLHWRPGAIRSERPRLDGGQLVFDLAIETDPVIRPGAAADPAPVPGAPAHRLSDPEVHLPFDCWVDFTEIARRLVGVAVAAGPAGGDSLRISGATPRGARDRLAVEVELSGALQGRAFLVGTMRCAEPDFALEAPDLDWSAESRRALEGVIPAADVASLASALDHLAEHARSRLRFDLRPCVARWSQALARGITAAPSGGPGWTAALAQRNVADIFCTDRAVGVRVLEQGRVRAAD
jgi:hypothetical protein